MPLSHTTQALIGKFIAPLGIVAQITNRFAKLIDVIGHDQQGGISERFGLKTFGIVKKR